MSRNVGAVGDTAYIGENQSKGVDVISDKKILYIDMDGVIVDFDSAFARLDPAVLEEFHGNEDQIPGLFALMTPIAGAIEAVTELTTVFDTYVLSTVPWHNNSGASQKIEWIQDHFGAEEGSPLWKRVILSHHKHLNRGDFLIDDRPHRNGAREFEETNAAGQLIHFGSAEFPDWDTVLSHLRGRV
jgi:5'-nucleotidase